MTLYNYLKTVFVFFLLTLSFEGFATTNLVNFSVAIKSIDALTAQINGEAFPVAVGTTTLLVRNFSKAKTVVYTVSLDKNEVSICSMTITIKIKLDKGNLAIVQPVEVSDLDGQTICAVSSESTTPGSTRVLITYQSM